MKTLTAAERHDRIGEYISPPGYYELSKSLPFLGTVESNVDSFVAGDWVEIIMTYTVGASGLADGAWIKGCFKFYSDWALFQTSDRTKDNFVSVEYEPAHLLPGQTPATVQKLGVRFDQKGHERPYQKAVIVDVVNGYLNPNDRIIIRLGDRRYGAKGTRAQTFIETDFRWRFYIDPVGTSRFAALQPDISWSIVAGAPHRLQIVSPRLVRSHAAFILHVHAEDIWGNVTRDLAGFTMQIIVKIDGHIAAREEANLPTKGWSNINTKPMTITAPGRYNIVAELKDVAGTTFLHATCPLTVDEELPVGRILFGDLHVHSDDTVGVESSTYNFTYGRDVAGLDVVGYTANDFQITAVRWRATVDLIRTMSDPGSFVIYPGTEWCGNSAAGGDHNVVFLADPSTDPPQFPFDHRGDNARSFEWSEDGPSTLTPGAWPLDEVYATYAGDAEDHLMIPHVGGRRCNLGWHHPKLERLVEIGSAWGHFEWLLQDSVKRGYKMGVSANSDEHRGRCGGGVPGTAVFGTRGGLTGIIAASLDRETVGRALRARHTFATTGPRLVGLVTTADGHMQGDEVQVASPSIELDYRFLGAAGFYSLEAFDSSGRIFHRNLWHESPKTPSVIRVCWGGARLYDRYREAVWDGTIRLPVESTTLSAQPFGGLTYNPEDTVIQTDRQSFSFSTRTSGDTDGVHISLPEGAEPPASIAINGTLGGYVKVGDPLKGQPHSAQPQFELIATWDEMCRPGGKRLDIKGGAELFVSAEAIPDIQLPIEVKGKIEVKGTTGAEKAVYFVGREWSGDKVISSPVFLSYV